MSQRIAAQFVSGGVSEPARSLTVRGEYDVIVAGGGLAGVSAAVASARAGARTLLLERNGFPGGVATAGMCCSVFNCYYTAGHELVVKGNSLEFVDRLAQAHGPGSHWHRHKGHIIYDVETAKMVLTDLVEKPAATCSKRLWSGRSWTTAACAEWDRDHRPRGSSRNRGGPHRQQRRRLAFRRPAQTGGESMGRKPRFRVGASTWIVS